MIENSCKRPRKRLRLALVILAAAVLLCLAAFASAFYLLSPAGGGEGEYRLEVPAGTTARGIAHELKEKGVIRSELALYAKARLSRTVIKAGSYVVTADMGVPEILALLDEGRSAQFPVSIPEGFTVNKIAALLEERGVCAAEDFIAFAHDRELLDEYDIPGDSFQGYLFPDTYFFLPSTPAERAVRMMADTFFERVMTIESAREMTARGIYDTVILASIVEREYRAASEAPLIAGVFANRLRQRWGLYSCATIEFIITEIQGKPHPEVITIEDTRIDNPYNTYIWMGLPPGPIANPGIVALNAAFNPAKTDYYYFRVDDAAQGTHHFSTDFSEHIEVGRAVTKRQAGRQGG